MYHFQKNCLPVINLPSMVSCVFCGTYDGNCHGSLGTVKTTTDLTPLDGFLYDKKAIGGIKISDHLTAVIVNTISMPLVAAISKSCLYRCIITAIRGVIGTISIFFLVDINHQASMRIP